MTSATVSCSSNSSTYIATYVSDVESVSLALAHGATELILEDSKLSIRCRDAHFSTPHLSHLDVLSQAARAICPDILLSVQCDFVAHHHHFNWIELLISALDRLSINRVRIQDPGVGLYILDRRAGTRIILGSETGNLNSRSVDHYAQVFSGITLGNEFSLPQVRLIRFRPNVTYDLVVHGPILLQYSPRRFMAGLPALRAHHDKSTSDTVINTTIDTTINTRINTNSHSDNLSHDIIVRQAQDDDYPGRFYTFVDTPHGHFMYLYFDRCLLTCLDDVMALGLTHWIVDGRGLSQAHWLSALSLYADFLKGTPITDAAIESLQALAVRPLKPGLFRVNNTDRDRLNAQDKARRRFRDLNLDEYREVGVVCDSIRGKWITVDLFEDVTPSASLIFVTPEGKVLPVSESVSESGFFSLNNEPLACAKRHELVKMKWRKGVSVKTLLLVLPQPAFE